MKKLLLNEEQILLLLLLVDDKVDSFRTHKRRLDPDQLMVLGKLEKIQVVMAKWADRHPDTRA